MVCQPLLSICRMVMKRFAALCLLLIAVGCSKSDNSLSGSSTDTTECGVERWHVKNLLDADASSVRWNDSATSIAEQSAFDTVKVGEFTPRLDFEKQLYSIPCTIVAFKHEDDSDIHLIIVDGTDSMIAEVPSVSCAEIDASAHAPDFASARNWVFSHLGMPSTSFKSVNVPATVTGILFQDFPHGQKGHARNYREIHPVTKIE